MGREVCMNCWIFTEWADHLRKIVADYPLHILEVLKYPNINLFQTDLGLVFGFLQNAKEEGQSERIYKYS